MAPMHILPVSTIQHDFLDVLSDVYNGKVPSEDVWISYYKEGETSVHGKVTASLHDEDRGLVMLSGREGVTLSKVSKVCDSPSTCRRAGPLWPDCRRYTLTSMFSAGTHPAILSENQKSTL